MSTRRFLVISLVTFAWATTLIGGVAYNPTWDDITACRGDTRFYGCQPQNCGTAAFPHDHVSEDCGGKITRLRIATVLSFTIALGLTAALDRDRRSDSAGPGVAALGTV